MSCRSCGTAKKGLLYQQSLEKEQLNDNLTKKIGSRPPVDELVQKKILTGEQK